MLAMLASHQNGFTHFAILMPCSVNLTHLFTDIIYVESLNKMRPWSSYIEQ